jgi:hypothetical protein
VETKIPAFEVAKNFGQISDKALVQPIHVTKHGRKHIVMISETEYELLKSTRNIVIPTDMLPDTILEALLSSDDIPPEAASHNDELKDWTW